MKNLAHELVGDLVIVVHNASPATDAEAARVFNEIAALGPVPLRVLVVSQGASPTPSQRRAVVEMSRGREVRLALVSDKSTTRMIAVAAGLVIRDLAAFRVRDIDLAFAHLLIPPEYREDIRERVARLQREVGWA